jgi:hypothetical protein
LLKPQSLSLKPPSFLKTKKIKTSYLVEAIKTLNHKPLSSAMTASTVVADFLMAYLYASPVSLHELSATNYTRYFLK